MSTIKNYLLGLLIGILIGSLLMMIIKGKPVLPKAEIIEKEVKVKEIVEKKVEITDDEFLSYFKRVCYLNIDKAWTEFVEIRNNEVFINKNQFKCFLFSLHIISETLIERDSMRLPVDFWNIADQDDYINHAIMFNVENNNRILRHLFGERQILGEFFKQDCKLFDILLSNDNLILNSVQLQFMNTVERINSKYDFSIYVSDKMKEVLTKERLNYNGKLYSYFDIMLANLLIHLTGKNNLLDCIMNEC